MKHLSLKLSLTLIALSQAKILKRDETLQDVRWTYGRHFPFGGEAVSYIYGPHGTFRNLTEITYLYNYYEQYATSKHPYNKDKLIAMSNGSLPYTTCRDANGHLLLDFNHDGEID
jgi:hypothetical protein